ncbi:hypothetical protein DUNSADRAFT_7011 [Dunaliella salina]|uniref:RING-CH-type domain-containing protein n=1 Tax=Dunaliella salina TaxID=3046 RepID=A0ABQ7GM45_DUNSA|nr:hypothetical protein DUNSADRAFT_7011 [Dunaliella salina]|eukprot:KAF5835683.1 hypothetical protein DUNSADRAFT_7011 [Dunaliella salina]
MASRAVPVVESSESFNDVSTNALVGGVASSASVTAPPSSTPWGPSTSLPPATASASVGGPSAPAAMEAKGSGFLRDERKGSGVLKGEDARECRVCLSADEQNQMVSACACSGTQKWAHYGCLRQWVLEKRTLSCELCGASYSQPYAAFLQSELTTNPPRYPPPPPPTVTYPQVYPLNSTSTDAQLAMELQTAMNSNWTPQSQSYYNTVYVAGPTRDPSPGYMTSRSVGRSSFWVAGVIGAGAFVIIVIIALAAGLRHSNSE